MRNEEGEGRGVIIELKEKRVESENEIDEKEERINEFINIQITITAIEKDEGGKLTCFNNDSMIASF